jgi:putative glutamine amidotransferase
MSGRRPVIGVLCCNEVSDRPVQVVASRFVEPLAAIAGATVLLVPAIASAVDIAATAELLDGLLLTGSRSNVGPAHYGGAAAQTTMPHDAERDEVALRLADRIIEAGKPLFGICRGLQEINVLFGGTLSHDACAGRHHLGSWDRDYTELFNHRHDVALTEGGVLARAIGERHLTVNSVHEQGIDRLGAGLAVEAIAVGDRLIEAVSARPCDAAVVGVQWHPEWDVGRSGHGRAFFTMIGDALIAGDRAEARRPRPRCH